MVRDNYDAYCNYERNRERDEYLNEKITDAEETIADVVNLLEGIEPTEEIANAIIELNKLLQRL